VGAHDGPSVWAFSGDRYTVKATAADTAGLLGAIDAVIPPGSGPPEHLHRNEDEYFYVLDGQLEVTTADRSDTVTPGGVVMLPRGVPHRFRNVGDRPCRMLLLFLPGGFERYFLEIGMPVGDGRERPQPSEYPAQIANAVRVATDRYGIEFV